MTAIVTTKWSGCMIKINKFFVLLHVHVNLHLSLKLIMFILK